MTRRILRDSRSYMHVVYRRQLVGFTPSQLLRRSASKKSVCHCSSRRSCSSRGSRCVTALLLNDVQHDVPHGQCHTRTSFKLFVCFKTFIAYSMCYCNIKLKWRSWSRSAPPHKARQSMRTRMIAPAFSWLRRELRLFTAGTRPLFWIQTEVPIFRKESCIICLGETCL